MTAERAAAPVEDDEPHVEATADLNAVPLTLPFIGTIDPVPMATIPAEVAELLGEAISPGSSAGAGFAATGRPPIR